MGGDPLAGCVGKVERASLHLEALHAAIKPFVQGKPKPYRFVSKVDVETSRYIMLVVIEREPPIEWSLIAGDFVQNLRAALDHFIWVLVKANGMKPTGTNAFPLFDQPPPKKRGHSEREKWNRMLAGVHPGVMGLIEFCQPYSGTDGPSRHILAALRRLSNEDKHRTLIPAFAAIEGRADRMNLEVAGVRDVRSPVKGGKVYTGYPLKNGSLVLEAPVEITGLHPEVELNGNLPLDVGFGWKPVPLKGFKQMLEVVSFALGHGRHFVGG